MGEETSIQSGGSSQPASIEPRMLERRISNNRADLSNDQQMNFILAWFNEWSELERDDFVPVLGDTLASKHSHQNGGREDDNLTDEEQTKLHRRPSLWYCQVSLYRSWVHGWSDDQKSYLILRLKEIDQSFGKNYEKFLLHGKDSPEKDYFEPGIPAELDRSSEKGSNPASLNTSVDDEFRFEGRPEINFKVADNTNLRDEKFSSKLDIVELEGFEKLELLEKVAEEEIVEDGEDAVETCSVDDDSSLRETDCLSPIAEATEE
jgi:hypothetical protein